MDLLVLLPLFLQEVFTHRAVVSGLHFPRLTNLDNVKPEGTPGAIYKSRSKLECASFCARDEACAAVMHHGDQCSIYRSPLSPSSVSLPGATSFQKQIPHEYLGCIGLINVGYKWKKSFTTELTHEFCMMNCHGNSCNITLMENGRMCYCGDDSPDLNNRDAENKCNSPCTGDSTKMCGGPGFFSVYKTN